MRGFVFVIAMCTAIFGCGSEDRLSKLAMQVDGSVEHRNDASVTLPYALGSVEHARALTPVDLDSDHQIAPNACGEPPYDARYTLEPGWICGGGLRQSLDCRSGITCMRNADCTDKPYGECRGLAVSGVCDYGLAKESCGDAADCTRLPEGRCLPHEKACYDGGGCTPSGSYCHYQDDPCEDDQDCGALSGGRCRYAITQASCTYGSECAVDSDCSAGERCGCTWEPERQCLAFNCSDDSECDPGQRCLHSETCIAEADLGPFCTTPEDACSTSLDCPLQRPCTYDKAQQRRLCTERCTVP